MTTAPRDLILIPGLLCDDTVFAAQRAALADMARIRVPSVLEDDSIRAMARTVLERAPERFALAGFSMGGYVAFEILRQAPARVERLALLDTSPYPDTPEKMDLRRKMIELARSGKLTQVIGLNYPFWVHASRASDNALASTIRDMNQRVGPEVYAKQQKAIMGRVDSRPLLAEIACPTLILCGDDDRLTPPAHHREMAAIIRGSTLEIVPQCGHMSTMEHPDAVNAAMRKWLAAT